MALTVTQDPVCFPQATHLSTGKESRVADHALERALGGADILIAPAVTHRIEAPEEVGGTPSRNPFQAMTADILLLLLPVQSRTDLSTHGAT